MSKINKKIFRLKRFILASLFIPGFNGLLNGAVINFQGNTLPIIEVIPEKSTGLDCIYVVNDLTNVEISFESNVPVTWWRYSNLGGGYAEEINDILHTENNWILKNPIGSLGYIIESDSGRYCFWLVDYSDYKADISSIYPSDEQDCDITWLEMTGVSPYIYYYTINGRQEILSREYNLTYNNLEWDSENNYYATVETTDILANITERTPIMPPVYCYTDFTLSSDRFMREWGYNSNIVSNIFTPVAVTCVTEVIQENYGDEDVASNQISSGDDGLGGSAPAVINFYAYVSDAVIHNEWQIADDIDFENISYRINNQDFQFTFTEEGTSYVRYIGSNSDGSCESIGDVYTINIGASELLVPNIFTPNDDGINDEWKVSYRSLLDFECWIFDRYGKEIYHFTDPSLGWDGKRNGKLVKSGVYFYVIQATGSDGKKYKKSGDINILIPKTGMSGSTGEE